MVPVSVKEGLSPNSPANLERTLNKYFLRGYQLVSVITPQPGVMVAFLCDFSFGQEQEPEEVVEEIEEEIEGDNPPEEIESEPEIINAPPQE
jgi:hypothetical protein